MCDQVPTHRDLDKAVAVAESVGHGGLFGQGVTDDPLFPIQVELLGRDGNTYAVTGTIERAIKQYLRDSGMAKRQAEPIVSAIRKELWSAPSYDDFVTRALCLVRVC